MTDLDHAPSSSPQSINASGSLNPNKSSGDIGKSCPFCGRSRYQFFTEHDRAKWGRVMCDCGACGPEVRTNYCADEAWHAYAIKEWNTRTPDPESAAEIERLRRERDAYRSALKGLSDMYSFAWDRADGGLMMMDSGVERFEKWHGIAYELLTRDAKEIATAESAVASAWEEAAKIADEATEQYMATAGFVKVNGRYRARSIGTPEDAQTMATAAAKSNASHAVAAAIRSRASAIRAAGAGKTAESGHSPSTHSSESE